MELANHIMAIEQQAHALAGQSFNIASPKQIQHVLYDQLKLPVLKKTPKGQPSTADIEPFTARKSLKTCVYLFLSVKCLR
jgi:DNA polymerase I-like protein with 3'-5' exonuclease and polymerase domains